MPSIAHGSGTEPDFGAWSGRSSNAGLEGNGTTRTVHALLRPRLPCARPSPSLTGCGPSLTPAWIAQPDGSFALKENTCKALKENTCKAEGSTANHGASIAEIKAAGIAKVNTAKLAREAEEAAQAQSAALWSTTFDFIFDAASDPTASTMTEGIGAKGRTLLVLVPGFASWASFTQLHADRWKSAELMDEGAPAARQAFSVVFKWPCGNVKWTSEDATVEAAAAWQEAHEATLAAARTLTLLLKKLQSAGSNIVLAAHSLGARVALQALANDLAAPRIQALFLLGAAVDNHALTGTKAPATEIKCVSPKASQRGSPTRSGTRRRGSEDLSAEQEEALIELMFDDFVSTHDMKYLDYDKVRHFAVAIQSDVEVCGTLNTAPVPEDEVWVPSGEWITDKCLQFKGAEMGIPGPNGAELGAAVGGEEHEALVSIPAEFPYQRLMSKCDLLALAHSERDPALNFGDGPSLWHAAEYTRCGRVAPEALGATGPLLEDNEEALEQLELAPWMEKVLLLDVSDAMEGTHDPTAYILAPPVRKALHEALFPLLDDFAAAPV